MGRPSVFGLVAVAVIGVLYPAVASDAGNLLAAFARSARRRSGRDPAHRGRGKSPGARCRVSSRGGPGSSRESFSGSKYLFVWRSNTLANANNSIAGRIMNANGTFATGTIVIAEAAGRQLRPVASG